MADVLVNVQQNVTGSADVQKAAAGMAKLAAQEERLEKLAANDRALGVSRDPKKLAAALKVGDQLEAQQARMAKLAESKASASKAKEYTDFLKRVKELENAEKKRNAKQLEGQKKSVQESKKFAEMLGKAKSGNLAGLGSEFGSVGLAAGIAASAVLAVSVASIAAGVGLAALATKITLMGLEAKKARDESLGLVSIYSNNDPVVVKMLSRQLKELGVDAREGEAQFVKLRRAGLSVGESARAITLVSDVTSKLGSKAGVATLEAITQRAGELKAKLDATKDPKLKKKALDEYAASLEKIRQQAGNVSGKGLESVAAKATTARGALAKIEQIKTDTLEKIGDKVAPSLDKLAQKVAGMIGKFVDSEKGQKAIDQFGIAVSSVLDGVGTAIDFVTTHWDQISSAISMVGKGALIALAPVGIALAIMGGALAVAGAAFTGFIGIVGLVGAKLNSFATAVAQGVGGALLAVKNMVPMFLQAGADLVTGLVNGVTSAGGRLLSAVGNLASGALGRFKSILGIASPSKVFALQGNFIGQGAAKGIEASTPRVEGAAEHLAKVTITPTLNAPGGSDTAQLQAPSPLFGAPSQPPQASDQSSGAPRELHIHLHGVDLSKEEAITRTVRRELESFFRLTTYMGGSE
jgi:hypothetical protein